MNSERLAAVGQAGCIVGTPAVARGWVLLQMGQLDASCRFELQHAPLKGWAWSGPIHPCWCFGIGCDAVLWCDTLAHAILA